jgi:hypothetical protein
MVLLVSQNFNRVNLWEIFSVLDDNSKFSLSASRFQVPGTHLDKYHNDWWIMELFPDLDQLTIQKEELPPEQIMHR